MSFLRLVLAEVKRNWRIRANYPFSFLMNMIQNAIFLGIAIVIIMKVSSLDQALCALLWPIAITTIGSLCSNIQEDIELGTLERIVSSKYSFLSIVLSRLISDILYLVPFIFTSFVLFSFFVKINLSILYILIITVIILLTGVGIGLILAGLLTFYKNIGPLPNLVMLLTMAIMVLPWEKWGTFLQSVSILVLPFISVTLFAQTDNNLFCLIGFANALLYLGIGFIIFKRLFILTKRKRGLSTY